MANDVELCLLTWGSEETVFERLVQFPHVFLQFERISGHLGDSEVVLERLEVKLLSECFWNVLERFRTFVNELEVLVAHIELEERLQERPDEGEHHFRVGMSVFSRFKVVLCHVGDSPLKVLKNISRTVSTYSSIDHVDVLGRRGEELRPGCDELAPNILYQEFSNGRELKHVLFELLELGWCDTKGNLRALQLTWVRQKLIKFSCVIQNILTLKVDAGTAELPAVVRAVERLRETRYQDRLESKKLIAVAKVRLQEHRIRRARLHPRECVE